MRDKARRLSYVRMAPKSVVMSEAQRRMVQSILRGQGNTSGACASSTAAFGTEDGEGACQPAVRPCASLAYLQPAWQPLSRVDCLLMQLSSENEHVD